MSDFSDKMVTDELLLSHRRGEIGTHPCYDALINVEEHFQTTSGKWPSVEGCWFLLDCSDDFTVNQYVWCESSEWAVAYWKERYRKYEYT